MSENNIEQIVFEIISFGGNAKGLAYEAIAAAEAGDFEKAKTLLMESDENLVKAHQIQTNIIQAEAGGKHYTVSVLFVHAQDHLMSALEVRTLADNFIAILARLHKLEKAN